MITETANFTLSTQSPLYTPTINSNYTFITFNNVDLKNIMGEMFDKYDLFVLKPISISTFGTVTYTSGSQAGVVNWNMRGLDWTNINYEFTPNQQKWSNIFNFLLSSSSSTVNYFNRNNGYGYTFRKSSRIVNLDLCLVQSQALGVGESYIPASTDIYSNFTMCFTIEPVIKGVCNESAFWGFNANTSQTQIQRVLSNGNKTYNYPNFDMKTLCKEFWDYHEDFEIQMYAYNSRGPGTVTGDNTLANIELTGLNFVNNLSKQSLSYVNKSAIVSVMKFGVSGSDHICYTPFANHCVQFKKSSDRVNLTLNIKNVDNTGLSAFTQNTTATQYFLLFNIRPIYNIPKATLFINPYQLTTTETNAGVVDANYTTFTLKNINIKQLCQNMWDKYDRFNIFLCQSLAVTGSGSANNQTFTLTLEGFDFINQSALISNNNISQQCLLGTVLSSSSATALGINSYDNSLVTTFYKTKEIVDLKLTANVLTSAYPFTGQTPLKQNFIFQIVGVEDPISEGLTPKKESISLYTKEKLTNRKYYI